MTRHGHYYVCTHSKPMEAGPLGRGLTLSLPATKGFGDKLMSRRSQRSSEEIRKIGRKGNVLQHQGMELYVISGGGYSLQVMRLLSIYW